MANNDLSLEKIYIGILEDIRRTDDISFKLLGLVPFLSGAGLLSILFSEKVQGLAKDGHLTTLGASILTVLSLFAAAITLGLMRWELRNVQTCKWLIGRAKKLEQVALAANQLTDAFFSRPIAPNRIGKEISEKLVYAGTIATWLALAPACGALKTLIKDFGFIYCAYYVTAALIATAAILSLFSKTSVPKL